MRQVVGVYPVIVHRSRHQTGSIPPRPSLPCLHHLYRLPSYLSSHCRGARVARYYSRVLKKVPPAANGRWRANRTRAEKRLKRRHHRCYAGYNVIKTRRRHIDYNSVENFRLSSCNRRWCATYSREEHGGGSGTAASVKVHSSRTWVCKARQQQQWTTKDG